MKWIDKNHKKNSKFGKYYLISQEGDDYTGETGYLRFKLIFEGIVPNYLIETYLDMKVNILIRIFFPIDTTFNLLKNDKMKKFFQMKKIYNSLPKESQWWRIDEDETKRMLKGLKRKIKRRILLEQA